MAALLIVPPGVALVLAVVAVLPPGGSRTAGGLRRLAPVLASGIIGLAGAALLTLGTPVHLGPLRADGLSAWLLVTIGAVGVVATWAGVTGSVDKTYSALLCSFLAAMTAAVEFDNLGLVWVAVEATTIATAFLVAHHGTRAALEAAWKYVVLCSVGIAVAFLGLALIYAASATGAPGGATLSWHTLSASPGLDPRLVLLGSALAVLGFATKAGLAPMHSWLPDAHSQAPAAVSALMSGVLLAVALYAIIRVRVIADFTLGAGPMRIELGVLGLLSIAVAVALLWRQRDYKRMLAYSSIEHLGLMAVGVAVGPAALPAVLLYVLVHGLIKASLFVLAGQMLTAVGSTRIADVRALLGRRADVGVPWTLALAALLGLPPFGIFFAELGILLAGWRAGFGGWVTAGLVLTSLAFIALVRANVPMIFGAPAAPHVAPAGTASEVLTPALPGQRRAPLVPIGLALAASLAIPFLAGPIGTALAAASLAGGGG